MGNKRFDELDEKMSAPKDEELERIKKQKLEAFLRSIMAFKGTTKPTWYDKQGLKDLIEKDL